MLHIIISLLMLPQTQPTDTIEVVKPHYASIFEKLDQDTVGGKLTRHVDPLIDSLISLSSRQNAKQAQLNGYRIQVYSTNSLGADMNKLKKMRDDLEIAFPTLPAYLQYMDPDFRIRVGNFTSRLEAVAALAKIRAIYPASYVVRTPITAQELKRVPMQDIETED
ncbi:MAG: SPOR domain-containing protein [Marinifilaceae bacterium]